MKKLMFILSTAVIGNTKLSQATSGFSTGTYVIKSSLITYGGHHRFHSFEAKAGDAKGKVQCSAKDCEILVAVPVKSFVSDNSHRDVHMIEITHGIQFPLVSFRSIFRTGEEIKELDANVEFAGQKHPIKLHDVKWSGDSTHPKINATSGFDLKDFAIEAPSLLAIPMDQAIKLSIEVEFTKQ